MPKLYSAVLGLKAESVGFAHQKLNRGINALGRVSTHRVDHIVYNVLRKKLSWKKIRISFFYRLFAFFIRRHIRCIL